MDNNLTDLVSEIINTGVTEINKPEALVSILGLLDITTLEGSDNVNKIKRLCEKAKSFTILNPNLPNAAAVCVYPVFVRIAKEFTKDTAIRVASVAGAFPSGQSPLDLRLKEAEYAISEGADELDMVISRGRFLEKDYKFIRKEISSFKKICGKKHLKVILETGELETYENVKIASELAIEGGADFIKTSTGRIRPAATPESVYVMLTAIDEHFRNTGKMVGIKPAGGISTPADALQYWLLVGEVLGEDWLDKDYFRIGASRLADKLLKEIREIYL